MKVEGADAAHLHAVILSYGHEQEFVPLLTELLGRHELRPEQVTVVHNPYDVGDRWTPDVPPGVHLVRLEDNLGYAGGMNAGLQTVRGAQWSLLLTHDARLGDGSVATMLAAGAREDSIGVVGPRLMLEDGTTWSTGVEVDSGVARHLDRTVPDTAIVERDAVDGTILLVRTDLALAVGGFEERFFMYWEETEFCLRVRRAGWRVVVAQDATAITRPGSSRRHAVHAYLLTRNGLLFGWRDAGARGLAHQVREAGLRCFNSLPHPILRRWRDPSMRRIAADRTMGTAAGMLDFARRRWGKPPERLRRRSDIA